MEEQTEGQDTCLQDRAMFCPSAPTWHYKTKGMKGEKGGGHRIFTQSQKSLQVTAFNAPDQCGEKWGEYAGILNSLFQPQQENFALAPLCLSSTCTYELQQPAMISGKEQKERSSCRDACRLYWLYSDFTPCCDKTLYLEAADLQ